MGLLQLLIDMVKNEHDLRQRFHDHPDDVLTQYGVTNQREKDAAKSENDWEILEVLHAQRPALVNPGEKKVVVTFCGVMKGTGRGGGGGREADNETMSTKRKKTKKSKPKKNSTKKKK